MGSNSQTDHHNLKQEGPSSSLGFLREAIVRDTGERRPRECPWAPLQGTGSKGFLLWGHYLLRTRKAVS